MSMTFTAQLSGLTVRVLIEVVGVLIDCCSTHASAHAERHYTVPFAGPLHTV